MYPSRSFRFQMISSARNSGKAKLECFDSLH
jgi:hypothetical protein